MRSVGVSWLASDRQAKKPQIAATGTLMKKIHDQPMLSQMAPPRIGPAIGATTVVIDHRPMAWPRWLGGKMRMSRVCDIGMIGPPQAPCITRKATSQPNEGAKPQSSEQTPKPIMPMTNTFTVPNRWESQPVSGTTMASATE